jgi:hypothetical protein
MPITPRITKIAVVATAALLLPRGQAQVIQGGKPLTPAQRSELAVEEYVINQGQEQLAYSAAVQAYVFTLPLFIIERERLRRERLKSPVPNEPAAPINQLGHMNKLATATGDLPYSPNNDTVYTGAVLDLEKEPIILQTPAILDRYMSVQVTDAYVQNQPYLISSRVNGGQSATVAFVGPDWKGSLPAGMQMQRLPTNIAFLAVRIRVNNQTDLEAVHKYQQGMSLTALSDWNGKPSAMPPKAPPERKRGDYKGDFAYFKRMAELLSESPPLKRDEGIIEIMRRIGIEAGRPFNPAMLSPAVRAGILRAEKDIPALQDAIRLNRGVETLNHWRVDPNGGQFGLDYVARAELALVGIIMPDNEESSYLQTFVDGDGNSLTGDNKYVLHLNANQIPKTGELGFWSLTVYDARNRRPRQAQIQRRRFPGHLPAIYQPWPRTGVQLAADPERARV